MKAFLWAVFEVVETVVIAVVAVILVRTFVAQPFLVSGSSMEPGFQNGDYLLIDELVYRFHEPVRGDVVVFKYPLDTRSYYIKRVIGLPGERVVVDGSSVTVYEKNGNKELLKEEYVARMSGIDKGDYTVKDGEYFVMGDNRDFSYDSRRWGLLPKADLVGLVRFRLWPIDKAMAFSEYAYN
ncbi:MAG: signal peptidase I [bacterium]|nr:signal peptidase I [Candidatus Jorgensenbacteria bacterium]